MSIRVYWKKINKNRDVRGKLWLEPVTAFDFARLYRCSWDFVVIFIWWGAGKAGKMEYKNSTVHFETPSESAASCGQKNYCWPSAVLADSRRRYNVLYLASYFFLGVLSIKCSVFFSRNFFTQGFYRRVEKRKKAHQLFTLRLRWWACAFHVPCAHRPANDRSPPPLRRPSSPGEKTLFFFFFFYSTYWFFL